MPSANFGPNVTITTNTSAVIAPGGSMGFGASILTPVQMTATLNDYVIGGFSDRTTEIQATPAAGGTTVNGIVVPYNFPAEKAVLWKNLSTVDSFTFNNENTGSSAVNRFLVFGASLVTIPANGQALMTRDALSSRWRFA